MSTVSGEPHDALIAGALALLRQHLGLDIAFVSQLTEGLRVFRYVDADDDEIVRAGASDPAEDSYCHYVAHGEVPEFLADPAEHPITAAMKATSAVPVGTHFSVPLRLADGSTYGTFCGFSFSVLDGLDERDLTVVRLLAELVVSQVEQSEAVRLAHEARRDRLVAMRPPIDFHCVFQPIVQLSTGSLVAFEALTRFPDSGPAEVFADAWGLGVGGDVELNAVRLATHALDALPAGCSLSINTAPETLTDERFLDLALSNRPDRLIVEITEHAPVRDYAQLLESINALKQHGVRLAVDDVGTGFSGLDHILRLEPDILKIDGAIVSDINARPGKQAMVSALGAFADSVGVGLIAEQVENQHELGTLIDLGVSHAQGYHLGRPGSLNDAFTESRARRPDDCFAGVSA